MNVQTKSWLLAAAAALSACSTPPRQESAPAAGTAPAGTFVRSDPAFNSLVPLDAKIEKLAGGFTFTEGPVWRPEGAMWFSDVIGNVVRQWTPDGKVAEILRPGG